MTRAWLAAAALLALAPPAHAWGVVGHAVVADIAEGHLTPAARETIASLLALDHQRSLDRISTWADDWSMLHRETKPWHYVDIPITAPGYDRARDCATGDCVVAKTEEFLVRLKDRNLAPQERLQALKFVVHFIGDLHQPLHAGENGDTGGNRVPVTYFGETAVYGTARLNLHSLWDTALIERRTGIREGRDVPIDEMMAAARRLVAGFPRDAERDANRVDIVAWTNQSHDLSRDVVYRGIVPLGQTSPTEPVQLGEDYDRAAWPVVEMQLVRAGLRLGQALNQALQ